MRTPHNESVAPDIAEASRPAKPTGKAQPERKCILSGEHSPRETLVRLAISPPHADGSCDVLPDPHAKAPGRGAWIGVSRKVLEDAVAKGQLKGALARGFKGGNFNIPDDLPQRIEDALTGALKDRLGLELRSGFLIMGTSKIAETARSGRVSLLLHASDSSEDGRKKLDQAWRVGSEKEGSGMRGITLPLDRGALSVALGRTNVVHLALGEKRSAARVQSAITRLLHFAPIDLGSEDDGAETKSDAGQTVPHSDDELSI
ncbi:MAG: DUF448 domain-containing protein [Erythrobacter sp.]